ncbi:MAG TPA: hypothetical protein VM328_00335 [Fimbriimonadaceae bacterium]|nr:hypothetical protein [Fimbriimonadaceae bacterium]
MARFDIVALQEVKGNIKCLRHMLKALGVTRRFSSSTSREGARATSGAWLSCSTPWGRALWARVRAGRSPGVAREVMLDALEKQFPHPYAAKVRSEQQTFILVTLHVLYGKTPKDRLPELGAIARWMGSWAEQQKERPHNLIVLGHFNIDRADDPAYEVFTSTGLNVDDPPPGPARTIFEAGKSKHYGQIAWFPSGTEHLLTLDFRAGGKSDFGGTGRTDLSENELSWRILDHSVGRIRRVVRITYRRESHLGTPVPGAGPRRSLPHPMLETTGRGSHSRSPIRPRSSRLPAIPEDA